jgi:hypothetical protein
MADAMAAPKPLAAPAKEKARLLGIIKKKSLKTEGGPFKLVSGAMSDYYLDMKPIAFDPDGAALIAEIICRALASEPNITTAPGWAPCRPRGLARSSARPVPDFGRLKGRRKILARGHRIAGVCHQASCSKAGSEFSIVALEGAQTLDGAVGITRPADRGHVSASGQIHSSRGEAAPWRANDGLKRFANPALVNPAWSSWVGRMSDKPALRPGTVGEALRAFARTSSRTRV